MGRRKLPSIPSHSSYSTTATYPPPPVFAETTSAYTPSSRTVTTQRQVLSQAPPPLYLSSSAPVPSTSSYSLFGTASSSQTVGTEHSMPPNEYVPQDRPSSALSRPSSAMSRSSYDSTRPSDPAIIPGATYQTQPKMAVRQTVSSIVAKKNAHNPVKIPNTLARVLLKKELKDALSRRKESLEACEIEANQRQYVVHKMLVTGLLPENRQDEIPNVIQCDLPMDLIRGARVVPTTSCTPATQRTEREEVRPLPNFVSKPSPSKYSTATQKDDPLRSYTRPTTSLRQQLETTRPVRPKSRSHTVETQTENGTLGSAENVYRDYFDEMSEHRSHEHRRPHSARHQRNDATQTTDLLEATRKYFEDYDRQLKELTSKAKRTHRRHYQFHNDDDITREERRMHLLEELSKRRERMCASSQLPSESLPYRSPSNRYYSSDYSSTVPHYGSLPRIDYTGQNRPLTRDYTNRDPTDTFNYGSLPRNYERCIAPTKPIQIEYEQSFGSRPYGQTSRSMHDLYSEQPMEQQFGRQPPRGGRSLNYIDQMDNQLYPMTEGYGGSYQNLQGGYSREEPVRYSQDTTNISGKRPQEMLSQYANYLSNQFQSGLLTTEPRATSLRRIDPGPLSDPYMGQQQQQRQIFDRAMPQQMGYPSYPTATSYPAAFPTAYPPPLSDPVRGYPDPSTYTDAQVYSRNEVNYGSRPAQYSMDYGNVGRSQLRRQDFYNPAEVPQTMQVPQRYNTVGYNRPTTYDMSQGRSWSNGNLMSAPQDDALSRMYATVGRRRQEVNNNMTTATSRRLGQRENRSTQSTAAKKISSLRRSSPHQIKRILLTRRYKEHNIYNDLGIRVVGGKRMENGELCSFVSAVNQNRFNQTLGEIKEGDQVLEWNGVLLNGKTFEEVERIVNSSTGEVEITLKSQAPNPTRSSAPNTLRDYRNCENGPITTNRNRTELSPDRSPPVPMHRNGLNNPVYDSVEGYQKDKRKQHQQNQSGFGHLQVAISYDSNRSRLTVQILSGRGLKLRDASRRIAPNPFVKVYLLPGRKVSHKRRTRFVPASTDPEWQQEVTYDIPSTALYSHFVEFSIWDYDKFSENNALGQVVVPLNDRAVLSGVPRWYPINPIDMRQTRQINIPTEQTTNYGQSIYNPASMNIGYPVIN